MNTLPELILFAKDVSAIRGISLNKCFLILGAPYHEVYSTTKTYSKLLGKPANTLRNRYPREDLLHWAKNLRKKAILRYHPDKPSGNEEMAAAINAAYDRIVHALRIRKMRWSTK